MKLKFSSNFKRPLLSSIVAMATIAFPITAWALPLSPGDRIRINIPSDEVLPQNTPETYRFSGIYEVNLDGSISLPLIAPISVVGMESGEINQRIQNSLVQGGYFQPEFIQVSTSIVQWAPIQINVMGATFKPGRILVEPTLTEEEGNTQADRTEPFTVSGEYPPGRFLTAAIRAAGGLKPTADVANIRLIRNGKEQTIDLTGVFTGETFEDVPLIAGDQVIVPELDKVHSELVRPSQVTPSEIAIFVSNQSTSNNDADGGGGEVSTVVYGTRFSQAVVAARCAGGTVSTNANRRVALIQTNRLTGETKILEQEVEELLRNPNNQDVNPHLMPEDSVICYDSNRSDIQGTASFINSILSPFRLIQSIFFGF